jgi:hypothetical protein
VAKESGLGFTTLSIADNTVTLRDIREDVTAFESSTPREMQEVTGVDKFAMERLALLADMSVTLNGVFDDASNKAHAVFSTVTLAAAVPRTFTFTHSGQTLGTTGTPTLWFTDYSLNRGNNGSLTWAAPGVLANGVVPTWS